MTHLLSLTNAADKAAVMELNLERIDKAMVFSVDTSPRILSSRLPNMGTSFTTVSGTAYFVYLGLLTALAQPKFVEFLVAAPGSGSQAAEVGFFSSPAAPNKANQSLTKLVSTGGVDALTTSGVKRNTSAFATDIAAGTHLWAGIRIAMATTQPTISGLCADFSQGRVLQTPAAGVLTGAGPFTGAIIGQGAYVNTALVPDLRATLD
jgi:hypothetical protein